MFFTLLPVLVMSILVLLLWSNRRARLKVARLMVLITMGFTLADAVMVKSLPALGLSFGAARLPFFLFSTGRLMVLMVALGVLFASPERRGRATRNLLFAAQFILLALAFYGVFIEPFWITVTRVPVSSPALIPDRSLRILQISDLHVERTTPRERRLIQVVEDIKPDIIVLTGDYLNIDYNTDARAISDARNLLSQLKAPYGVYAIPGTRGVDRPEVIEKLFEGLDIHFLRDETEKVELPGGDLYILGLQVLGDGDRWRLQELIDDIPSNAYTLLLYHTPDMAEYASNEGVNLYLAGHTHGGQVRLPGYGALVTFSKFGKKYEMGKYELGHTLMYVSRGIGMEGLGMPRIRFLAPPEVVLVEAGLAR